MPNKYLVILRGLPGSGKSTYAKRLVQKYHNIVHGFSSVICSADYYFIRPDNVYDWNAKLLKNAHEWCYKEVKKNMRPDYRANAIDELDSDYTLIALDNTNLKRKDFKKYIDLATKYGYIVKEIVVGKFDEESCEKYFKRNVHGVPLETIKNMARGYEK